jgi:hypothetical protein
MGLFWSGQVAFLTEVVAMRRNSRVVLSWAVAGVGLLVWSAAAAPAGDKEVAKSVEAAQRGLSVDQARREVRLLDDLYKTAVVYINDVYVQDANSVAAGETARDLFAAMKKKGWHEARLVDATGSPLNDANVPQNDFEKAALSKIRSGEAYVDQVVSEEGRSYLRAATVVPVVNEKCVLCHPGNKVGGVLGAISYKILLE